jgi:hypothetical protein
MKRYALFQRAVFQRAPSLLASVLNALAVNGGEHAKAHETTSACKTKAEGGSGYFAMEHRVIGSCMGSGRSPSESNA